MLIKYDLYLMSNNYQVDIRNKSVGLNMYLTAPGSN